MDSVPERLEKATSPRAITWYRSSCWKRNGRWTGAAPRGEEKMAGVMCRIDAVGYQARDGTASDAYAGPENPTQCWTGWRRW